MSGGCPGCPTLDELERGGPAVDAHLADCAACRSVADLMTLRSRPRHLDDCARAEVLIAAGAELSAADALYLRAHLARCAACADAAREPPPANDVALPCVPPETYALGAEIGRGGMGRVIAARDRRIGRGVALKEMLEKDPVALARFEREARITARLQHPSIVSIYEVGRWPDGRPFYAMPILPGRTLREAIAAAPTLAGRLRLLPSLIAAAEAIAYAHSRRVIHRDLSPANILLGAFGETTVIDWGVAKDLDEDPDEPPRGPARADGLTAIGTVIGTPAYIAPEQADGGPVDERADVHALGAVLYQLLAGRPPYDGVAPGTVIERLRARQAPVLPADRAVPRDLLAIVRKAMQTEPSRRYPSAAELAEDLRRYQAGERVEAYRYSRRERASRWLSRRLALVVTSSVMLTLLAVTGVVGAVKVLRERRLAEVTSSKLRKARRIREISHPSQDPERELPIKGWTLVGRTGHYDAFLDRSVTWQGRPAVCLRSTKPRSGGTGAMMQVIAADAYRGRRVRLSGFVRSSAVEESAMLVMRVVGKDRSLPVSADEMDEQPIRGTTDWQRHDVVLDVGPVADILTMGIALSETGAVWVSGLRLEVVDRSVPVTVPDRQLAPAPRNLDFSDEAAAPGGAPWGWLRSGIDAYDYDMFLDPAERHDGKRVVVIRSNVDDAEPTHFGTLLQQVEPAPYRGKRVRFSALLRTDAMKGQAALWLTIAGPEGMVSYDNMEGRRVVGTTGWKRYAVERDVFTEALTIGFGILLEGTGKVSVSDATLEVVARDRPAPPPSLPTAPVNLDFSR